MLFTPQLFCDDWLTELFDLGTGYGSV